MLPRLGSKSSACLMIEEYKYKRERNRTNAKERQIKSTNDGVNEAAILQQGLSVANFQTWGTAAAFIQSGCMTRQAWRQQYGVWDEPSHK